jgi:hypothetical protein
MFDDDEDDDEDEYDGLDNVLFLFSLLLVGLSMVELVRYLL